MYKGPERRNVFSYIKLVTILLGVIAIFTLECIALDKGYNGVALSIAVCVIGGLLGYTFKGFEVKIKK